MKDEHKLNDDDFRELVEVLRKNDAFWAILLVSTIFATEEEKKKIIENIERFRGERENDQERSG